MVTDHIAYSGVCSTCQETTKAVFPDGIKTTVQDGPQLTGRTVSLNIYQLILIKRLVEIFQNLFGVPMG